MELAADRLECLAPARIDRHVAGLLRPPHACFADALARSQAAGLPSIQVSEAQGRLLALLVGASGARRVLEIGTLAGYSTLWLASALPEKGGQVHTIEIDPRHAAVAQATFAASPFRERIVLHQDDATKALARWVAQRLPAFDFCFIDADKRNNVRYAEAALALSRPGSLIVVDNVIRSGAIIDPACTDENTEGARAVIAWLGAQPRVEVSILQTVGDKGHDGIAIARVMA